MKKLNNYITEKLKINKDIGKENMFSDEELREDYNAVNGCFSKSEKIPYMKKYGVTQNKIQVIQQEILRLLRENRKRKNEYSANDARDFYRMNIPDTPYHKSKEFFDKEPFEFIQYLKSYFEKENQYFKRAQQAFRRFGSMRNISIADRHQLNMYNNVVKYLEENS